MTSEYFETECRICHVLATRYFGRRSFPLCDNIVCEQTFIDELNFILNDIKPTAVEPEDIEEAT